jgi:hypothetical protein
MMGDGESRCSNLKFEVSLQGHFANVGLDMQAIDRELGCDRHALVGMVVEASHGLQGGLAKRNPPMRGAIRRAIAALPPPPRCSAV